MADSRPSGNFMKIKQLRYSADNLGYLICTQKSAMAIDGGAVNAIVTYIEAQGLQLKYVTQTHSHPDHVAGNQALLKQSDAVYLDHKALLGRQTIELDGEKIKVFATPGHTVDSVSFHLDNILITGDTLFNGTVGNCFTGDLKRFYQSIKKLMAFPGDTIIYAGHDYVEYSMAFAKIVEPLNKDVDTFLQNYNPDHVFSTLAEELKVNPFLRFNEKDMISVLKEKGLAVETEYERWEAVMSLD
jgi:hydroxyacylglutathione hydrolase